MSVFYYHTNHPMPAEARSQRDPSCRLCNKTSSTKKRILYREWRDERVNSKIETLLGIRLLYHHHLSNTICEECYEKLSSFDTFVKMVLANQVLFSQNLSDSVFEVIPISRIKAEGDGPKPRGKSKAKSTFSLIRDAVKSKDEGVSGSKPPVNNIETEIIEINSKKPTSSGGTWTETIFLPSAETSQPIANIGSISIKLEPPERHPLPDADEDDVCIDECDRRKNNQENRTSFLEITSVRSYSNTDAEPNSSKRLKEKSQADDLSDSDCVILDDDQPSKRFKSTPPKIRVSSNIYADPPPTTTKELENSSRTSLEISVKGEPLGFDDSGAAIKPITIKQEKVSNDKDEDKNEDKDKEAKETSNAMPKVTYRAVQRVSNCLPCFRCNQKNESYLNLLYHHINRCSTEVPESDPDPPLVLIPEDFRRQCEEIETEESVLLRQINREINECLKNTQTLRNYYSRMIDLTRPVLLKYCEEQGILLNVPICSSQSARRKFSKIGFRKKQ